MRYLICILLFVLPPVLSFGADVQISIGDPETAAIRKFTTTGSGNIASSVSITTSGTEVWEVMSVNLHLSAAGGANNLTITKDAGAGSAYDAVVLTQDMTTVTDLIQLYEPGELVLDNDDQLDFAWTNGSGRTYGLEVIYKMR